MTKIWWISIRTLKSLKHLHFAWFVLCKPYNVWPKKHREVFFYDTEELCKIWRKTCGLQNEMRNLANFNQNTWKCQNWYFHKIFLSKIENTCAKNLQRSYDTVMTLHNEFDKFWLEHSKVSKNYSFIGCLWPKYIMFEVKKYMPLKRDAKLRKKWLVVWKITWWIWQIFTKALENLKIGTFMVYLYPK